MSLPAYVAETLQAMTLLQLLLAFVASIGYALGQGALLERRNRRWAWSLSLLGAFGFAWMSPDWTQAAVLFGFAVAGMGLFTAAVWLLSRGLQTPEEQASDEVAGVAAAPAAAVATRASGRTPAHST